MKSEKFVIVFILLVFIFVNLINIGIGADLNDDIEGRVVIKLKEDYKKFGIFSASDEEKKELKEELIDKIGEENIKHVFENEISAELTKKEVDKLNVEGIVENIKKEGIRHIFLQTSVGLMNANGTYRLMVGGLNLTGKGESVCIIDTGINYTHPDLGGCWGNNNLSSSCKALGGADFCANNDGTCSGSDSIPEDVNGHGTHVAGIVGANGTINGVAPEARLIMIKACNATGSCFDGDIQAGILWCVNNASKFNISVISMSLGGGGYADYCNDDPLASYINTAVGSNISVIVSTGNDGYTDRIAAPACVQNATPVGSVRKDGITIDYNRNLLLWLLGYGYSINSTYITGSGYASGSGTSMATPHVSGAIAILSQYLRNVNRTKTPAELEQVLNDTGIVVSDSGSGLSYSRIRVYNAIISLDVDNPNITLVNPADDSISNNRNQTFRCNATDLALRNMTFYLWNSTNDVLNTSNFSIDRGMHSFEINISNLNNGEYNWNCRYEDEKGNRVLASSNYSISIGNILVQLISPVQNTFTNRNQTFVCNGTANSSFSNVSVYLWNSTRDAVNITVNNVSGIINGSSFNLSFLREGAYEWNCLFVSNESIGTFASANRTITYDLTKPMINVLTPENSSYLNVGSFNVSLDENGSCGYSLNDGANNVSMSGTENRNYSGGNNTLSNGFYNLSYYCNDTAGNLNLTRVFFNIDTTTPNVTLIAPVDGHSATGTTTVSFQYNVSDNLNMSRCALIYSGSAQAVNGSAILLNETNTISKSMSVGSYTWQINCTDIAGNTGNSTTRSLTINSESSSSSSSSSGGGSSSSSSSSSGSGSASDGTIYLPSANEMEKGYSKLLKAKDIVKFNTGEAQHSLTIDSVGEKSVSLTIKSSPISIILFVGESKKINLSSAEHYDLFVKLNSVGGGKANLAVQAIKEAVISQNVVIDEKNNTSKLNGYSFRNIVKNYNFIGLGLVVIVLIVILKLVYGKKKKSRKLLGKGK